MLNKIFCILLFSAANLFVINIVEAKQTLFVAIGWDKPPYVMEGASSGFEVELIQDVFDIMGYEVKFVQIPYGRSYDIFKIPKIDAVMTLSQKLTAKHIYLSQPYIRYQNSAVSLSSSKLELNEVNDLSEVSIVGFQSAFKVLGDEFLDVATVNSQYKEVPDQERQVKLLLSHKTQVIVLDVNIFTHYKNTLETKANEQPAIVHQLFVPTLYRAGFIDQQLKIDFDTALESYFSSTKYQQLIQKYHFYNAVVASEKIDKSLAVRAQ